MATKAAPAKRSIPPKRQPHKQVPKRQPVPPVTEEEEDEVEEDLEEEDDEDESPSEPRSEARRPSPRQQPKQDEDASRVLRPKQEDPPRQEDGQFEKGFPSVSLFEGKDFILFQGTFDPDELRALIDQAQENSVDQDKIRVKIFDVDDQYQKGPARRVRLNISGLQARNTSFGGKNQGSKRW